MARNQKGAKETMLLFVSAAFVGLMLTLSSLLCAERSDSPIHVEYQSEAEQVGYSLEEPDISNLMFLEEPAG